MGAAISDRAHHAFRLFQRNCVRRRAVALLPAMTWRSVKAC